MVSCSGVSRRAVIKTWLVERLAFDQFNGRTGWSFFHSGILH